MENQLELVDLTSQDIKEQLKQYDFEVIKTRNNKVEYMNLPYFVRAFYNIVFYENYIPSFKEFMDYYLEINEDKRSIELLDDIGMEGVRGRASRAYPSLVRDIHFALLLDESLDLDVMYNINLDVKKGIDVLVANRYGFHLFYDSQRSHEFRRKKDFSHNENKEYIEFDLPFRKSDGIEAGNVFLYCGWHVVKALELMFKEERDET